MKRIIFKAELAYLVLAVVFSDYQPFTYLALFYLKFSFAEGLHFGTFALALTVYNSAPLTILAALTLLLPNYYCELQALVWRGKS